MKKGILMLIYIVVSINLQAQVGINGDGSEPDSSAMLDVKSTDKGMLIPRMTSAQRNAINNPATGLLIFDNETTSFWFYNGSAWTELSGDNNWSLNGNTGTDTSTNFIGTTDDMPLDVKVNNQRVMRYQPATDSPNLIGGYSGNTVSSGTIGATIAGGGVPNEENTVAGDFGVVGGGADNNAVGSFSTVGGGLENTTLGKYGTVGGGWGNEAEVDYATVGGGWFNYSWGFAGSIIGGYNNELAGSFNTIGGGRQNQVNGNYTTVPGGRNNKAAGDYSFAAGRKAWVDFAHGGTFLFADTNDLFFYSAAANEFAARATGGVRFVTNIDGAGNPTETITMDSTGTVTASSFIAESGDGPAVTLNQNASEGYDTYTWKILGAPAQFAVQDVTNAGKLPFRIAPGSNNNRIIINGDNVGIGMGIFPNQILTATEALDVNGKIKMREGAANGYIPVSDVDGVMIWTDPLTLRTNSWNLNGNAGTDTSINFIGTTDNMPFFIKVNNRSALRIKPNVGTVNLIGGYEGNSILGNNTIASTIGGGGVAQGENIISADASYSTISGGVGNLITVYGSTIGGGFSNQANSAEATVGGGVGNIAGGLRSTIGGGRSNTASGTNSTVAGGGGFGSGVSQGNTASGQSSTVGGGSRNTASGGYSTVPGGDRNSAGGDYSFAAGRKAKIDAAHDGTFLFADQNDLDFNSSTSNEFAVRATGGVRFVTAIDGSGNPVQTVNIDNIGTVTAAAFVGDGSGLTNVPGDNLGNHTATQTLDLANHQVMNGGTITATAFVGDGSGLTDVPGDNLGNHTADTTLNLNGYFLSGDGDNEGVFVNSTGKVGIQTNAPASELDVHGDMTLTEEGNTLYERRIGFSYIPGSGLSNYNTRYSYIGMTMDGDVNLSQPATQADQRMDFRISNNSTTGTVNVLSLVGNGRVGVGTTAPNNKLTVNGSADFTGNVGIGIATPSQKLDVNGNTTTDGLQVGSGTMMTGMQVGKVDVGTSVSQVKQVSVSFPTSFSAAPMVICTAATEPGTNFNDSFNVTVRSITSTGFVMVIQRLDGTSWGQDLDVNWFAVK
ncbi:MAG: H-type lectin domain-containing protein [Chitinophagales bacterium]